MKTAPIITKTFVCLSLFTGCQAGAGQKNSEESLGPLIQYDPYAVNAEPLTAILGNPRRGLITAAGFRVQRVSDDKWYLGLRQHVALMEPNFQNGEVLLKKIIKAEPPWCVSPSGKQFFGGRPAAHNKMVWECFRLASGASQWAMDKDKPVYSAVFSADGKRLIVLHALGNNTVNVRSAVSWYDSTTGDLFRTVNIPGELLPISGDLSSEYLAEAGGALYVARPSKNGAKCFVIRKDDLEAKPIGADKVETIDIPQLRAGGPNRQTVAFYNDDIVCLYREENGATRPISEIPTENDHTYNRPNNVRFSPDGTMLTVTSLGRTIHVTTSESADSRSKIFPIGTSLGDYTTDGKYFVYFHDGGGLVYDAKTWTHVGGARQVDHPHHCCPIKDAVFSTDGNLILSNDGCQLLLWSRDGRLLAELVSPRARDVPKVKMQSPVILDAVRKIYAADGWNFLEWDLQEIAEKAKAWPGTIQHVSGTEVFRGRKIDPKDPELMNIQINPKGDNIITATRQAVRFRPLATSDEVKVWVLLNEIPIHPRSFHKADGDSAIYVNNSGELFRLDSEGKEKPKQVAQSVVEVDSDEGYAIRAIIQNGIHLLSAIPLKEGMTSQEPLQLPEGCDIGSNDILKKRGKWIVARARTPGELCSLLVIDWSRRQVVWNKPLPWAVTSLDISRDGKRLAVGSYNKAVYTFDFERMCAGADKDVK